MASNQIFGPETVNKLKIVFIIVKCHQLSSRTINVIPPPLIHAAVTATKFHTRQKIKPACIVYGTFRHYKLTY